MPVPASYNDIGEDASLRDHVGLVWYDRRFHVPPWWVTAEQRIWLRFSSAHYAAEVFQIMSTNDGSKLSRENGRHVLETPRKSSTRNPRQTHRGHTCSRSRSRSPIIGSRRANISRSPELERARGREQSPEISIESRRGQRLRRQSNERRNRHCTSRCNTDVCEENRHNVNSTQRKERARDDERKTRSSSPSFTIQNVVKIVNSLRTSAVQPSTSNAKRAKIIKTWIIKIFYLILIHQQKINV